MAKKTARRSAPRKTKKASRKTTGRTARKTTARKSAKKRGGRAAKSKRTPNAAFMRPVTPSPKLAEVVGAKPIPRTEVTKRLWAYIRKNGLQDTSNKRMIKADAALQDVFGGRSQVNMFEMTKLVNKHLS